MENCYNCKHAQTDHSATSPGEGFVAIIGKVPCGEVRFFGKCNAGKTMDLLKWWNLNGFKPFGQGHDMPCFERVTLPENAQTWEK
jgi:hypothetical protein